MKIAEIFRSLQGEGENQGKPCLFIRLAGCNLHCHWCDTPYAQTGGIEMNLDVILEKVWRVNPPCLYHGWRTTSQADDSEPLLVSLHTRGTVIDIETNGTINFSRLQPDASICMDVKCPSSGQQSNLALLDALRPQDSVKFVVEDESDFQYAREIITSYRIPGEIFLSPFLGAITKR